MNRAAASGFARSFVGLCELSSHSAADHDSFSPRFFDSAYFTAVEVAAVTSIGLGVALLLSASAGPLGIFRIMLLVPWAIAPVANAVLWKWILNANYGILNVLLSQLGVIDGYVTWLGTPWRALNMILLVDIWKSMPFIAILFSPVCRTFHRCSIARHAGWRQRLAAVPLHHSAGAEDRQSPSPSSCRPSGRSASST